MGKSHQSGWVSLRGKQWFGYFRRWVLDPETNEEREKKICVKLALKSQMTKLEGRDALRAEITKQTGKNPGGGVLKDNSVTFEWFVRNRYFPFEKETGGRRRRKRRWPRLKSISLPSLASTRWPRSIASCCKRM